MERAVFPCRIEGLEDRLLFAWGAFPQLIDQDEAVANHPTIDGRGVVIANLDTGVVSHPSLAGRIWKNPGEIAGNARDDDGNGYVDDVRGWDFVGNDNDPYDDQGHGTMTTGLLAANRFTNWGNARGYKGDNAQYQGIASGATVVPLRVIDASNKMVPARVESALRWVLANHERYNIVAVNMSLTVGESGYPVVADEMKALWEAGVFIAAAAGNASRTDNQLVWPAAGPYAMAVGALNADDTLNTVTSRGPRLDILAPGNNVPYLGRSADYYPSGPATSPATPFIAAAGALIKQINPEFGASQVRAILKDSGKSVYDPTTGLTFKRLDLDNAIALALKMSGQGQSPTPPAPVPAPLPRSPFRGSGVLIPNVIEAENFDHGAEGLCYHDTTRENEGGVGRDTGVDLTPASDAGNGLAVTSNKPGEWLEYTVSIPSAGEYDLFARVSSAGAGGTMRVELDGQDLTGPMSVPNTGSFSKYVNISKSSLTLPAGTHILRLRFLTAGASGSAGNVNWLKFSPRSASGSTPPLLSERPVGVAIQAERPTAQSGLISSWMALGYIDNGDWARFSAVNFGSAPTSIIFNLAALSSGGRITIRTGSATGRIVGSLTVAATGSYSSFKTQSASLSGVSGVHDLYLSFSGGNGIANIDWFKIV
jgi:hypothetical protein